MNDNELSKALKGQAVSLGLCEQWTQGWGESSRQELIDKYLHGIDFCIDKKYPTHVFIKEHFDKGILHKNNIFIDEDVQARNMSHISVLNGNCTGILLFDGFASCDVYVRHDSDVTIDCSRFSKVFINAYDRARVKVVQKDMASVYVYIHGEGCTVEAEGDVLQRKR